ncbi:unnamed protein product [Miscanthus lutarioriparius]|uniref:[RNA-polymerase]-subunit kinase n=1 Tax=Miscanthus lutarioriparius TaxID=422564 RepID=A0A811NHY5_9POAL|nr:unnamed protein product [Miscanthus lutarioriparius]
MTDDELIASGTIMDATRLAAVCAKIDEYAAGGAPMSGNRISAICAMIDDGAAAPKHRRNMRRRRLCVDSTRSYKQIGEIGNGSFGAVIKARHRKTGLTVAIKKFRRRGDGKKSPDVRKVLREACFLAACGGHPNLVGLHAVARDPCTKEYSVVMEYVGPSLRHALKEHLRVHGAPFPEADVRRVMRQLLTGAEAMHSRRIIHSPCFGGRRPRHGVVDTDSMVYRAGAEKCLGIFEEDGIAINQVAPPIVSKINWH